ncbi:MAG: tetratricopeptide repeat protein [Bacteroidota bacterium]
MGVTAPLRAWVLAASASISPFLVLPPFVLVTGALATGAARTAQAADDPASSEAKRHYEEGTKAFNLGEYPRAIAEFKATYNAKPDPLLLYNIAQSYRLAGDAGQALFFYKSFLRNMPAAANRKEVEGHIKTLQKQVAEQKKDPDAAPPAVAVPPVAAPAASPAPPSLSPPPPSATISPHGTTPAAPAASSPPGREETPPVTAGNSASAPYQPAFTVTNPPANEVDLTTPATPPPEPSRPIYKRWWFWAGTAGAVVIIGALAAANAKKGPNTQLGTFDPTFMP